MTKLSPARRRALIALMEAQDGRGFVRDILAASTGTLSDARDEAFALTLALGVTATVGALDEALDRYIAKPSKVSARVRMALRIPAFEMLYLDTPGHVAVSQGVELVRSQARSAAGLANAVLRRVDEGRASASSLPALVAREFPFGLLACLTLPLRAVALAENRFASMALPPQPALVCVLTLFVPAMCRTVLSLLCLRALIWWGLPRSLPRRVIWLRANW